MIYHYFVKIHPIIKFNGMDTLETSVLSDCAENAVFKACKKFYCRGLKKEDIKDIEIFNLGTPKE